MLMGWPPRPVEKGDAGLGWGAAGGLGSMALEITRAVGGRPIAVVSDDDKRKFCMDHGAAGVVNRTQFTHWGKMPGTGDAQAYREGAQGARGLGQALLDALRGRVRPK